MPKMFIQNSSRDRRRGFTLIEIMVAAVITIIMIGLVIQITSEVLKLWNRSVGKLSANAEARVAMEVLTSDLESAVIQNDGMLWLYAKDDEDLASVAGYSSQTITLAMLTPAQDRPGEDRSDNDVPGNICAVQYELVYQDPVTGEQDEEDNAFALHRRLIDPATTFSEIMGEDSQESFEWLNAAIPVDARVNLRNDGNYALPEAAEYYLAGNIVNFQVEFFVLGENEDGDEVARVVPSPVAYGGDNSSVGPKATDENFRHAIEYADITMTIISDEGMAILRNLEAGRAGTGYETGEGEAVILEHGEVFKRRVHFHAKPL